MRTENNCCNPVRKVYAGGIRSCVDIFYGVSMSLRVDKKFCSPDVRRFSNGRVICLDNMCFRSNHETFIVEHNKKVFKCIDNKPGKGATTALAATEIFRTFF